MRSIFHPAHITTKLHTINRSQFSIQMSTIHIIRNQVTPAICGGLHNLAVKSSSVAVLTFWTNLLLSPSALSTHQTTEHHITEVYSWHISCQVPGTIQALSGNHITQLTQNSRDLFEKLTGSGLVKTFHTHSTESRYFIIASKSTCNVSIFQTG
jgi:hypothetical protein